MSGVKRSKSIFGISVGVEDGVDLDELTNTKNPKHPKNADEKMVRILEYMEEMQLVSRDNTAILYQMLDKMEEKMNKRIDNLRVEMIALIEKKAAEQVALIAALPTPSSTGASASSLSQRAPAARRASVAEVKLKSDSYINATLPPTPPPAAVKPPENFY